MSSFVNLEDYAPLPEGDEQYGLEFIENKKALKLFEDANKVHIGMVNTNDLELIHSLEMHHLKELVLLSIEPSRLTEYLLITLVLIVIVIAGTTWKGTI